MKNENFKIGWENLQQIDGEAGARVIASLQDISPDLANYIISYVFGEIYARQVLPNKTKELLVVACLTTMSHAQAQLKVHLQAALQTGNTINEVKEVLLQLLAYAGFPAVINAMQIFESVLQQRAEAGIEDSIGNYPHRKEETNRLALGKQKLSEIAPDQLQKLKANFMHISPELIKFILEFAYADLYARDNLSSKMRELVIISALMTLGHVPEQLSFHMQAALRLGINGIEIEETIILLSVFTGFPAAINAMQLLRDSIHPH